MALFRDVKRAEEIHFCNRNNEMNATNVQEAIEELKEYIDTSIGDAIGGSY